MLWGLYNTSTIPCGQGLYRFDNFYPTESLPLRNMRDEIM
jgi:hypothetical protein